MEPDLIILLGNDDAAEAVVTHSQVLATQSDYVHVILSNQSSNSSSSSTTTSTCNNRNNNISNPLQGKMICFPDVNRTTWDKAMEYLQPGKILDMILPSTTTDAQQQHDGRNGHEDDNEDAFVMDMPCILPFYQQYSFQRAVHMCDRVLSYILEDDETIQACVGKNFDSNHHDSTAIAATVQRLCLAATLSLKYHNDLPRSVIAAKTWMQVWLEMGVDDGNHGVYQVQLLIKCMTIPADEAWLRRHAGKVLYRRHQEQKQQQKQQQQRDKNAYSSRRRRRTTYDIPPRVLEDYVQAGQYLSIERLQRLVTEDSFASEIFQCLVGKS